MGACTAPDGTTHRNLLAHSFLKADHNKKLPIGGATSYSRRQYFDVVPTKCPSGLVRLLWYWNHSNIQLSLHLKVRQQVGIARIRTLRKCLWKTYRISGIALSRDQTLSYRWIELQPTHTLTLTTQKRFLLKVCVAPSLKLAKRWRKARRSHCRTRSLQACGKPCNGPPHPETPWDRECDRIASCPQPTPRCSEESRRHGRWSWWGCCAARSGLSTREYSF